jgi:prevent-host-death family protein
MKTVGLRELKNRLSEYVREVRSGESFLVPDRGQVVAELLPPGQGLDQGGVSSGRFSDLELLIFPEVNSRISEHHVCA